MSHAPLASVDEIQKAVYRWKTIKEGGDLQDSLPPDIFDFDLDHSKVTLVENA